MLKKSLSLALAVILTVSFVSTSVAYASERQVTTNKIQNNEIKNGEIRTYNGVEVKFINDDIIEVKGQKINLNDYVKFGVESSDLDDSLKPIVKQAIEKRSKVSIAIKAAIKWLKKNWPKVVAKVPKPLQKYAKIDFILSAADTYIGVSDSVEDFFHRCFRKAGLSETANWTITKAIMLILPI